jgi:hypothetical protein
MFSAWLERLRRYVLVGPLVLAMSAGGTRADDDLPDLGKIVAEQNRVIEELKQRLAAVEAAGAVKLEEGAEPATGAKAGEADVRKIVADYLRDNPGAGMPPSVQTGYFSGQGYVIRSAPSPSYVNWADESRIPFELRIRGRMQLPYYYYKVTDNENHQTGRPANGQTVLGGPPNPLNPNGIPGGNAAGDFSQLEIKRLRLIFEGTAFDPNLRYHIQFDGSTRGIAGVAPGVGALGGGNLNAVVDHAARIFQAYIAYDWRPTCFWKGCGEDCPEGTVKYAPTVTFLLGKAKPFLGLEEYLGSTTDQFVDYSMASWMFSADDDNQAMMAGAQVRALEDRLLVSAFMTNGNDTQIPNLQMDRQPGVNLAFWYDFGGSWNEERKRLDLFGDHISDIDYSCNAVVRAGAAVNYVPMNRRTLYSNAELSRVRVMPAPPGGAALVGILNGGGAAPAVPGTGGASVFAVDAFDATSLNLFLAGKYRGLSLYTDLWARNVGHFRGIRGPNSGVEHPILYQSVDPTSGAQVRSLFPATDLIDFGQAVHAGYFIVPKKLEVVARWSWVRGESGAINGVGNLPGQFATVVVPGVGPVRVVQGAFDTYSTVHEYALGVNWYWKRQNLKWQNDFSVYDGGNPAAGGQSAAGFIPGVDGWMIRSQVQLFF